MQNTITNLCGIVTDEKSLKKTTIVEATYIHQNSNLMEIASLEMYVVQVEENYLERELLVQFQMTVV